MCMNRRMDANRALKNLNKFRLHGKQITLAWAPGKGMKDKQWKDYWDLDLGCSYIPIEKLDPQVCQCFAVYEAHDFHLGQHDGVGGGWDV